MKLKNLNNLRKSIVSFRKCMVEQIDRLDDIIHTIEDYENENEKDIRTWDWDDCTADEEFD